MDIGLLMLVLLIGVYCLFSIFEAKYDVISPGFLCGIMFMVSCIFLILYVEEWNIHIGLRTIGIILIGLLMFWGGEYWANKNSIYTKTIGKKKKKAKLNYIEVNVWILISIILMMVLATVLYYRELVEFAYENGYTEGSKDTMLFYVRRATVLKGISISSRGYEGLYVSLISTMSFAWAYISLYILIYNYILFRYKKNCLYYIIICLIYILQTVLSGGRTGLIYFCVIALVMFIIINDKKHGVSFKGALKYMGLAIGILCVLLVVFYNIGGLTGKTEIYSLKDTLSIYLGSSIYSLDQFVEGTSSVGESPYFGAYTLTGVYNVLAKVGIMDGKEIINLLPFVKMTSTDETNVYTSFMRYIADFGVAGFAAIQFLMGTIFGTCFRWVKKEERLGVFTIIFSIMMICIFQISIEERFFMNIISMGYIIRFVWIVIFYKIFVDKIHIKVLNKIKKG